MDDIFGKHNQHVDLVGGTCGRPVGKVINLSTIEFYEGCGKKGVQLIVFGGLGM